ncbi:MAG: hypothetical protein AAF682_07660 [Planctomycetota bacterium]
MQRSLRIAAVALAAALGGCSGGDADAAAGAAGGEAGSAPRSSDPRVAQLRDAIEFGRLDLARTLLQQVESLAGAEAPLLRARTALLAGDSVGALRAVEEARAAHPDDARVCACAAEVYAVLGRFEAASDEIAAGLELAGRIPALERATGVSLILQPGGSAQGLEHLLRAVEADPQLPFVHRPLSQAHLLEGRRRLAEGDAKSAFRHAQQAREHDPHELYATELEADCRAALNDFDSALQLYRDIEAGGKPTAELRADLHQRAATYELVQKNRTQALDHYRQARELGLDDEALGFGAVLLREEAQGAIDRGIDLYSAGDLGAARRAFEEALEIDATQIAARNHLGVVLFRQEDYAGAAAEWARVLEAGRDGRFLFPEPVELNLARALKLDGRVEEARGVLREQLEREPDGRWAREVREALNRL